MSLLLKGVALAASNAVVTAVLIALAIATGQLDVEPLPPEIEHWRPAFREPTPWHGVGLVVLFGVPFGMLWGVILGSTVDAISSLAQLIRALILVASALFAAWLFSMPWPAIQPCVFASTAVHAVLFARWTSVRGALPPATLVRG